MKGICESPSIVAKPLWEQGGEIRFGTQKSLDRES